jgi:hypothetical protein
VARYATEKQVVSAIKVAEEEARSRKLNKDMRLQLVIKKVGEVFASAPDAPAVPPLVNLSEAAEIVLGRKERKGHLSRLRERGEIPEPAAETSSGPVWIRSEIEKAAARLQRERAARDAERAARVAAEEERKRARVG